MERTNFGSNKILLLPLTRIDFAALVSSRAVRISSRAVRVFPALSLRRVRPSYATFSLMVLQGNCARGRTGHVITLLTIQLLTFLTVTYDIYRSTTSLTKYIDSCVHIYIIVLIQTAYIT